MGAPRTRPSIAVISLVVSTAVLVLGVAGACGDPDQYLRHAKADAGPTLPITTGDGQTGRAGSVGTAGSVGSAGTGGSTGAAGTFAASGSAGAAGTIAATGTAGTTGAAGATGGAGSVGAAGSMGAGGSTTGAAGAVGTCPGCKINVTYTCLSGASDSRNFTLEAKNTGATLLLLKELTLRYWYTIDAGKEQELDCDTARLTCQYIITNQSPAPAQPKYVAVTPPRNKATEYVEIAFTQGAIDVGGTTGPIQLRLHNKDFTPVNQANDYSADCGSTGQAHDSGKITAYVRGVLVGGTEPQ